ncbi:MAG: hypothetical protein FLDDKLPJ_00381 [Phycisphaerae bacterium]|nr:hypothetical protein [Phycisphaerae bacterium]
MILAKWNNAWFIASKARAETPSCSLSAPDRPGLDVLGFRVEERSIGMPGDPKYRHWRVRHRFMPTLRGITFYPTIRYKELRVDPIAWNPDSSEPLLLCRDSWEPGLMTDEQYVAIMEELKARGWKWDAREGGQGYLHVDDLTKIEGPPPSGAF